MPVWHVSVSHLASNIGDTGQELVEQMNRKRKVEGILLATNLLKGVGNGQQTIFTTDPPGFAIHVQTPLSQKEISLLPFGWMDILATDDRGPCKLLKV